ncbi:MATE family efflux transporter [Faecalibaculum rodentium]|uniref:MATE family efflux transporter n=2 Tax=Faecalibaculum rodentium TaxID=1702221 RepID=UPI00259BBA1F|nr:MATE family efflux transporter [Faecalibaculum rodentium]
MTKSARIHDPALRNEFIRYTSLSIIGILGVSCYILADTWFIAAGLGTTGLAALNLAIPVYSFLCGIGMMLGMGGSTQYTLAGARDQTGKKDRIWTDTVILGLVLSIPFVLFGAFGPDTAATWLGADAQTLADTATYLRWLMLFAPAFMLNYILQAFMRNDGSPHLATWAQLAGSFLNIVLDWFFIFPCNMGMFGAIFATALSPVTGVLVMLPHFRSQRNTLHFTGGRPGFHVMMQDVSLGFPSFVTQVSAGIVMIVLNTIFLTLAGNTGVAAYGVIANVACVTTAVFNGVAQGMQPLTSAACAAHDRKRERLCLHYAIVTTLVFSALVCLVTWLRPGPIAAVFNSEHDPMLQAIAVQGLELYFLSTPFAGICIVLSTWFASVHDPKPGQLMSIARGFVLVIPLAYGMAALFSTAGAWLAVPVAEALTAFGGWLLYRRHCQKTPAGSL